MPELGLSIGTERGLHEELEREWLYWYDQAGHKCPAPESLIAQERRSREQAQQKAQRAQQETEQMARTMVRRQLSRQLELLLGTALDQIDWLSMPQMDALSDDL